MNHYCRTCLEFIADLDYFGLDQTIPSCLIPIRQQLQTCIPGIDTNIVKNAVICSTCSTSLAHMHRFYEKCMRSETKVREIVQGVELMNGKKGQTPVSEQYNVEAEQLTVDIHTEIHKMGYTFERENTEKTENYDSLRKGIFVEPPNEDLVKKEDFSEEETECCDNSSYAFSDSAKASDGDVMKIEETENYINSSENFTESIECENIKVINEQDTFNTDSKLCNCYVKLTRLSDSTVSTKATIKIISGKLALKCVICSCIFKTKEEFENHKCRKNKISNKHILQDLLLYNCIICEAAFPDCFQYNHHMNQSHNGELAVKCGICGIVVKYSHNLKRHTMVHAGMKPFKCDLCDNRYTTKHCLVYHMRSHSGEKPVKLGEFGFKCNKCSAAFKTNKTFKQHMCIKNSKYMMTQPHKQFYKCTICECTFPKYTSYKHHMCENHNDEVSVQCSICDLVLKYAFYLKEHMQIHTGKLPFNCNLCYNRFKKRNKLDIHIRLVHSTSSCEFKCIHCNNVFNTNQVFKEHLCEGKGEI